MLVLTRKAGESIVIGSNIRVTILELQGRQVRLGIEAPSDVSVHRGEVYERIREENELAAVADHEQLKSLSKAFKSR